jgi:hypothetical protein
LVPETLLQEAQDLLAENLEEHDTDNHQHDG